MKQEENILEKNYGWKFWKHLILSIVIVMITLISDIIAQKLYILKVYIGLANKFNGIDIGDIASLGIIGASDGPTSVLVSSATSPIELLFSKVILCVILLLLYFPVKAGINLLNQKRNNTREE